MTEPDGPRINLAMVILAGLLPSHYPVDPLAFGLEMARKYGDIAYLRIGPLRVYQLCNPDYARQILVEEPQKYYKPRVLKHAFRGYADNGLLTSDGEYWRRQRRLVQPAFHQRRLAVYADIIVEETLRTVDAFANGEVVDIGEEMAKLTLRVVVKSLFGSELPREAEKMGELMVAVFEAANIRMNSPLQMPRWIPTRRNIRERRSIAGLNAILDAVIVSRRAAGGAGDDLLSLLLAATDEDNGTGMTDRQLRGEMMTLFLAGYETTAVAMTWAWYLLAKHPEVEAKLQEELDAALGARKPAMADLPQLPYTETIIREAMRLYPPAPVFAREPIEDVTIAGYRVPKGSLVTVNTYALHRDARFFPDPERFDPERFAKGWEERGARYAYLPFGGGPRICIGNSFAMMEARLILATLAQRFRMSVEPPADVPAVQKVTLRPASPVRMRLLRR
jgi:cytochrome P450